MKQISTHLLFVIRTHPTISYERVHDSLNVSIWNLHSINYSNKVCLNLPLTLQRLWPTKRSYILEQSCSWKLRIYNLLVKWLKLIESFKRSRIPLLCFICLVSFRKLFSLLLHKSSSFFLPNNVTPPSRK